MSALLYKMNEIFIAIDNKEIFEKIKMNFSIKSLQRGGMAKICLLQTGQNHMHDMFMQKLDYSDQSSTKTCFMEFFYINHYSLDCTTKSYTLQQGYR